MKLSNRTALLLLSLASAIWGFSFVAQRLGMQHIGPFTFNGIRFALGAAALAPFVRGGGLHPALSVQSAGHVHPGTRVVVRRGVAIGLVLFVAASLQQVGVVHTTAGKAGFITGLYVVLVPILGLVIGQKTGKFIWMGAVAAAVGLYLLSATGWTGIGLGDGLVLLSAVFWAVHVLLIGRTARLYPPLTVAMIQFAVVSVLSLITALIFETWDTAAIRAAAIPILYAGLLSVAVAYTLQVVGQQRAHPSHAAIILSMESVFAAVGGWLILSEVLSAREFLGMGLMMAGILLAQKDPHRDVD